MPLDPSLEKTFNDIRRACDSDRLAQAYLLVGSVRAEGMALARQVLALLFCPAPARKRPCGACPACQAAFQDRLPDVFFLEPVSKGQIISVDEVRDLCRFTGQTSFAGGAKAGVLLYADRMTQQAGNAFLKALEEPPPRTLFLLLSDQPHALLPTILSRCQKVSLPANHDAIRPWMERVAAMMGNRTFGALGALAAAAELGTMLEEKRAEIEKEEYAKPPPVADEDKADKIVEARITARYKEARVVALRALLLWHRDVLAAASGADAATFVYAGQGEMLKQHAGRLTVPQALSNVDAVEEMQAQLEQNVNESVVLEGGLARLKGGNAAG